MTEYKLKYGCNPNQNPARIHMDGRELPFEILNGAAGYINLLDAFNSWQLVKELKEATGLPSAASFKHVSPAGAAVAQPLDEVDRKVCMVPDGLELSPIAQAYVRARSCDRQSSFGDFAALSDVCDISVAKFLQKEVSDGIIAPGYTDEALELLKSKRRGNFLVIKMDPDYAPDEIETKQVFGIKFEQKRNNAKITMDLFDDMPTKVKEIPQIAKIDDYFKIYSVQLRCLCKGRSNPWRRRRSAKPNPLHKNGRRQGRYALAEKKRKGFEPSVYRRYSQVRRRQRYRPLYQQRL